MGETTTGVTVWENVLEEIKKHIGEQRFALWFKNTRLVSLEENLLKVGVPNRFIQEWIEAHFGKMLKEGVSKHLGTETGLKIVIDPELFRKARDSALEQQAELVEDISGPRERKNSRTGLKHDLTLSNFVVGLCNELAYAAAKKVIAEPGKVYNPLFIHGSVGVGKTHILQGICHALRADRRRFSAIYASGEAFTNQFIMSMRSKNLDAFRHRFRQADALIIDDVHFLANKEATQQELLHTFNALNGAERQIVLASDSHPKMIQRFRASLINRFISGMVVELKPPDYKTRLGILKHKSLAMRKSIPTPVLELVAREVTASARELEGMLYALVAYASLSKGGIDIALAREVLKGLTSGGSQRRVSLPEIESAVSEEFNVSSAQLKSHRKSRSVALPRQVCMYLARQLTNYSYSEIGDYFGRRNHTVALNAFRKISRLVKDDEHLREIVKRLEDKAHSGKQSS